MSNKESIRTLVLKEAQAHPEGVSAGALADSLGLKRSQVSAVLTQLANGENPPVARVARGVYAPNGHAVDPALEAGAYTSPPKAKAKRKPRSKRNTMKQPTLKPEAGRVMADPNPPVTMASFIAKHFDLDSNDVDMVMHYFARFGDKIDQ